MTIELSMLAPHFPSICHEEQVPEFQQKVVDSMKEVSKEIAQINPGCHRFSFLPLAIHFHSLC